MRILFDQSTPVPLRAYLTQHLVSTASQLGWSALKNGDLLTAAEEAGFDVLLTTDRNMRYQQNLTGRKIAVVILSSQQCPQLRPYAPRVVEVLDSASPGSYLEIEIPAA
jgi:predicted nuclease of predicted toxin-antitoxin system